MMQTLLLDLDDTILDFHSYEYHAIRKTLRAFDIDPTDAICEQYRIINLAHWKALERKQITRAQLEVSRFTQLFDQIGVRADAAACGRLYYENLSEGCYFIPGALEALKALAAQYELYMVTNGTAKVQHKRIANAGIAPYFKDIFISEEMGADKPDMVFFQNAFARIGNADRTRTMIVGDSLSSDIQGGKNAGIMTCWINPGMRPAPDGLAPDHAIQGIYQLPSLLQSLK